MNAETLTWIEDQKPNLVRSAESYIKEYKISEPREVSRGRGFPKARVSGSQLRNLLSASQSEGSLAVLVNFLRYQIGRGRQGWDDQDSGRGLESLLHEQIGKRITDAGDKAGSEPHQVESRLASLLLGYVIREYTYRCQLAGTSTHD